MTKASEKRIVVALVVSPEMKDRVNRAAHRNYMNPSAWVRNALAKALDNAETSDRKPKRRHERHEHVSA